MNSAAQGQRVGRWSVQRRAERVSRPTRLNSRRRSVLVVTMPALSPMRAVQRARLWASTCTASQAPLAAKRPEGRWFNPTPYFKIPDGVLELGVAAVVGLEGERVARAVGDEGVIVVGGEEGELGARGGLHAADDEPGGLRALLPGERRVGRLGHVGAALEPVRDGAPGVLRDRLDELVEPAVEAHRDAEAHAHRPADPHDLVGIEAAVGPQGELAARARVADPPDRLAQEVGRSPGGVGAALAQAGHEHVTGPGGHREQGVVAAHASVAVVSGALFLEAVRLADRQVEIDRQGASAGTRAGRPRPRQQEPADPIELAHMAPAETAQERPEGGGRLHGEAQHPARATGSQRAGVVDGVAARQRRRHEGQQLVAHVRASRLPAEIEMLLDERLQAEVVGQGGRQQKPRIGHQVLVIKGRLDPVGAVR